jgi:hypothetical protein
VLLATRVGANVIALYLLSRPPVVLLATVGPLFIELLVILVIEILKLDDLFQNLISLF